MITFERTEWCHQPPATEAMTQGRVRVNRNVQTVQRQTESGEEYTAYVGESAIMSETAYASYAGATQVETKRENAIIDQYTQELIEGGIL